MPQGQQHRSVPVRVLGLHAISEERARTPRGISTERKRSQTPPNGSAQRNFKGVCNLENFETFEMHPRTVFNSPRSLAVCAQLGIHPTELLPRTIRDFIGPGIPSQVAQLRLRHFDERRTLKLQKLREARAALVHNDGERSHTAPIPESQQEVTTAMAIATKREQQRRVVIERAKANNAQREHDLYTKQLQTASNASAVRLKREDEKMKLLELQRLRWEDRREEVEQRRRREEFASHARLSFEGTSTACSRSVSKYHMLLARERYKTPSQRNERVRASSASSAC